MVWKAKSNHFRLGERNSLFLHEFDAARSTDAGGSGFDHGEHFLAGMDTTTGLDAHIRSNGFAHKLNGLNGRAAFGETGRGLHEVRASGFAGFAGRDDFIIGEKAITFVYVEGEIADRSKGEIQVEVKFSDVSNLMIR